MRTRFCISVVLASIIYYIVFIVSLVLYKTPQEYVYQNGTIGYSVVISTPIFNGKKQNLYIIIPPHLSKDWGIDGVDYLEEKEFKSAPHYQKNGDEFSNIWYIDECSFWSSRSLKVYFYPKTESADLSELRKCIRQEKINFRFVECSRDKNAP